ncbi:amino acid permease [Oleiagrimonas sp. C23AA]|uniref:amino acid permease n=1 Tax=Oleiagrimonas sp. C23AA TaxID=2719047 RepID=UPI00142100D9|nr:amino acid permease [Oleiagrimonas sp. C23AA]NII10351.1 amino acid permease [Oleiagrimonas sp. C23AA]
MSNLFITKPVHAEPHVVAGEEVELARSLDWRHLIMLGIGAVIGAGIFVITGTAAAEHAGPAIILSFVFAGLACAFAALSYAELSAMIPVSGSAYSYTYSTLGESAAWFVGWSLVLEYLFAASTVAVGWAGYTLSFLDQFGMHLPSVLREAPFTFKHDALVVTGAWFNLPAVLIIGAIAMLCYRGIKESATVNAVIVAMKVLVVLAVVIFGAHYVTPANWHPFIPANEGPGIYGWSGVFRGASIVFFAYIGFDAVSTAAQEVKNPQRDMPIGILGSLFICTLLYILMAAVLTGMLPYKLLDTAEPVATALAAHPSLNWLKTLAELAAIAGLSTVILVMMMGQPRIFFAMAHDGLMPKVLGKVHPKYKTPHRATIIVAIIAAVMAALLPISLLGDVVSMGTLVAFATVSAGVLILRYTQPELKRSFRVPLAHVICPLGVLCCLGLIYIMPVRNWLLLLGWTVIGFIVYFSYGYKHSKLRKALKS